MTSRKISGKHSSILLQHYLNVWEKRYIIGNIGERYANKRNKIVKYQVLKAFEKYTYVSRAESAKINKFSQTRNFYAVKRCVKKLLKHSKTNVAQRNKEDVLRKQHYFPSLQR